MTQEKNYFDLLGMPLGFDLDMAVLSENYRALQRATHPDRFASASDKERRLSVQQAAQINDAYNTLKSPLSRAIYLLSLNNIDVEADNSQMDPMFLMEQMELRETLEAAEKADDAVDRVADLLDQIDVKERELRESLSNDFAEAGNDALKHAAQSVRKLQFFTKLKDEAEQLEARLDD